MRVVRRSLTLPTLFLATALLTLLLPLTLPTTWLLSRCWRGARAAPRVLLFLLGYLWCEVLGVLVSTWLWLRHGGRGEHFIEANYQLQLWWAGALKRLAQRLFRLRFEVRGQECLFGPGVIMLPRHCSIGDTVIPIVFYCQPSGHRLRYVMKKELLLDPCLDLVGNRLPNYFVDRSAQNTEREIEGIQALTRDLPANEGILIYPEGTRFASSKRATLVRRLRARGLDQLARHAASWEHVLPPRLSGPTGLLKANPGRDVVFCAHTGFEGSASFAQLFNGDWLDTCVRIHFWRVPFTDVPRDEEGLEIWLLQQWDRMNQEVAQLKALAQRAPACQQ